MANFSFISNISTRAFTSAFDRVEVETDLPKVSVTIIDGEQRTVYDTTLYAYGGKVVICDLATVFEHHMEAHDMAFTFMWLRVADPSDLRTQATMTYGTFYGRHRYCGSVTEWVDRHFLNASPAKVSFVGSTELLNWWYPGGSLVREHRTIVYEANGEQLTAETVTLLERQNSTSVRQSVVDYNAMLQSLGASRILSVSVAHGERMATIYYTHAPVMAFLFRNAYNTLEVATVQGMTKRKAETDRSLASCNRRVSLYNKRDKYSFEVETAPMPLERVTLLEQLCTSHKVWMYTNGAEPVDRFRVVITDHTIEVSDSDDKLQTVKFTFQFEDSRLVMTEDISDIFTGQFIPNFN